MARARSSGRRSPSPRWQQCRAVPCSSGWRSLRPPRLPWSAEDDPRGRRQTCSARSLASANFLLRMVDQERPRAVLVGWDTLDVPNYRHKAFPAYQGGRHFDKELLVQLDLLPLFVAACGFAERPRLRVTRLTISWPPRWRTRSGGAETAVVASGDRDTFQPWQSASTVIVHPLRAGDGAIGPSGGARSIRCRAPVRSPTSSHCVATRRTKLPGAKGIGLKGEPRPCCEKYGTLEAALTAGRVPSEADRPGSIAGLRPWTHPAPLPALRDRDPDVGRAANAGTGVGAEPVGGSARRASTAPVHDRRETASCQPVIVCSRLAPSPLSVARRRRARAPSWNRR